MICWHGDGEWSDRDYLGYWPEEPTEEPEAPAAPVEWTPVATADENCPF